MAQMETSRRTFLALGAAAMAVPPLSAAQAAAPAPAPGFARARKLKLGMASYSTRKFTLDQTLEMCREMGAGFLTLKDMHLPRTDSPEALAAARRKVEAAGVTLMGGGVIYMKNDEAQVRQAFEYARAAGLPLIVGGPEPDALELVEKMIREFSIPVAIHNHGPEDKFYPAPQDVLRVISSRDKRLGICMDLGHAARTGKDPVQAVFDCKERILDVHVKDLTNLADKDSLVEVGRGVLDVPGFLAALVKIGFAGHVALEYEINPDSPLAGMKESLAYMRGVVDGLGRV